MVVVVVEEEEEEEEEEIGSVESKLVREGRASASRCRGRCRQEGSWFLPSRWVLGRAIKAGTVKASSGSRQVRVLEAGQSRINLASGRHSVHGRCGRSRRRGSSWF